MLTQLTPTASLDLLSLNKKSSSADQTLSSPGKTEKKPSVSDGVKALKFPVSVLFFVLEVLL